MRIGINALSTNPGGARTYLTNLLGALARTPGDQHHFVVFLRPQVRSLLEPSSPRFTYHEVPASVTDRLGVRLLWEQLVLPRLLRRYDVDVLYSPGNIGCWAAPVPSVLAIQYTSVFDNVLPEPVSLRKLKWTLQGVATRLSVGRVRRIVVLSEWSRFRLSRVLGLCPDRLEVIPHGLDERFGARSKAAQTEALARYGLSRPYVLAVSNLMPHKNYPALLRAFARLTTHADVPQTLSLAIAGENLDQRVRREMEHVVEEEGLKTRVHLLGGVPHGDLPALYSAAEAFVFPTRSSETFGFPLVEAMGCQVPVAASRAGAIPEICGDAARYFDPDDPEDMAECVRDILTDPGLAAELRQRGTRRARAFSWHRAAARTLAVLVEAGARSRSR